LNSQLSMLLISVKVNFYKMQEIALNLGLMKLPM